MVKYDINWLKEKGFFEKIIPDKIEGREVVLDDNNRLAYTEVSNNEEVEKIRKWFSSSKKIKYIWFYFPREEKVKVFRRYIGELHWFWCKPDLRKEFLKSREDKLSKLSVKNIDILFDTRDIAEMFYWQLWKARIKMAKSIQDLKEDGNKLLVVQHLLDRLIFFYFLAQLGLVRIKNKEVDWKLDRKRTREFFKWICEALSEKDLQDFLNKVFFDVLGEVREDGWSLKQFTIRNERFSVVAPSLDGGLFVEDELEGKYEREIIIKGIKELILEILNKYNWVIGEEVPEEEDVIGDLTPEIIGHIYEKFVVSLGQISVRKIKLRDIQTVREELRYGRKKIGAYYTPEEITKYISMNTIYPYIRDRLKDKFSDVGESLFNNLFEKDNFSKEELAIVKYLYFEILTKVKICDNACGSGSFLIAAGDVLLRLYSRILKTLKVNLSEDKDIKEVLTDIRKSPSRNYYIVRQIIVNNLYGVDIMEGAVEIAKLRFWLWLISKVASKKVEDKRIETLPNLDFNLVVGNSLIGFIDIEDIEFDFIPLKPKKKWETLTSKQYLITTWTDKEKVKWLKDLAKKKQEFKTLPARDAIKLKEKLNKELEQARKFLDEKFLQLLKSQGIEISKEEFLKLKPLHWGFEFYEVFDLEKPKEERGFDIVIGNPPYGDTLKDYEKRYCESELGICSGIEGSYNIAAVFIGRSLYHMKQNGYLSYIVPNTISRITEFLKLRKFVLNNFTICAIAREENPFRGVHLEMDTYILKKQVLKNYIVRILNKEHKTINKVSNSVFKKYNRFIYMWDDISEFIWSKSQINVLKSRRGPYVDHKETKSGDFVNTYLYNHNSIDKYKVNKVVYIKKTKKEQLRNHKVLSSRNMYRIYRCIWNSEKFYPGQGIAIILNYDGSEPDKSIVPILNSKLMDFVCMRYIFNMHNKPSNLQLDVTSFTPIRTDYKKMIFSILCDYMLFLNATEKRRSEEKELINFIDNQIIDSLVYELYFKEKLKTNLLQLVEPYLKDIENMKSDEEKLKTIKQVAEKIRNDGKVMKEIEKIKSHKWVKIIEGM